MNIFSVIIMVIAGIGILNLLLMAVYERTREIGLLGAMGLKPRQIAGLFLLEGTLDRPGGSGRRHRLRAARSTPASDASALDYSQFANITEYMALISGRVYPTLGLQGLPVPRPHGRHHLDRGRLVPGPGSLASRTCRRPPLCLVGAKRRSARALRRDNRRSIAKHSPRRTHCA